MKMYFQLFNAAFLACLLCPPASYALKKPKRLARALKGSDSSRHDASTLRRLKSSKSSKYREEPSNLTLCVVDDRGFAIPEEDPSYEDGRTIYSEVTLVEGQSALGKLEMLFATFFTAIAGIGGVVATVGFALNPVVAALVVGMAVTAGILYMAVGGVSDETALILTELNAINAKLDDISNKMESLADEIMQAIGDQALDEIRNPLHRMYSSYQDYVHALSLNSTTFDGEPEDLKNLRVSYREAFRFACNELEYTPKDLIGILNGHACGDPNKYPGRCETDGGQDTGACENGNKQRLYLLDKYRLGKKSNLGLILEFKAWLLSAMVQAYFLQTVCLPPNRYTCSSGRDPVFLANIEASRRAINETVEIFQAIEDRCICPCKKVIWTGLDIKITDINKSDPEVTAAVGVIRGGESAPSSEFREWGTTGMKKLWEEIPKAAYPGDTLKFYLLEDDKGEHYDDLYEKTSSFDSKDSNGDPWYDKACNVYRRKYVLKKSGENPADFYLSFIGLPGWDCQSVRDGFCSDDLHSCAENQYCDKAQYECRDKKTHYDSCSEAYECLSGDCVDGRYCKARFDFNETCSSNLQCKSGYCYRKKCCPPGSGCQRCIDENDPSGCGHDGNCATCQTTVDGPFCKFGCDRSCGSLCSGSLCGNGQCTPTK